MISESLVIMVRFIIGDTNLPYTYSDEKLAQCIAVAAVIVSREYYFATDYVIDIAGSNITPDPMDPNNFDAVSAGLLSLKASCIIKGAESQQAASNSIEIADGSSRIKTSDNYHFWQLIMDKGPCFAYSQLLKNVNLHKVVGKAVVSPPSIGIGMGAGGQNWGAGWQTSFWSSMPGPQF